MFNLQSHRLDNLSEILRRELAVAQIVRHKNTYKARIGDETIVGSLQEIQDNIKEAIAELKKHAWGLWDDLAHLCGIIVDSDGQNSRNVQNSIFLHSARHAYLLSSLFSDLKSVTTTIKTVFFVDISTVEDEHVEEFNLLYLRVRLVHYLILREMYRLKLIRCYMRNTKIAQISGPWANLDLPMKERMWEWDDEEDEYFSLRDKAIKEQVRYNPEVDNLGFYFIWTEATRDPYLWTERETESPYKTRSLLNVASTKGV